MDYKIELYVSDFLICSLFLSLMNTISLGPISHGFMRYFMDCVVKHSTIDNHEIICT